MTLTFDAAHTALLVMDFQVPVVEMFASSPDAVLEKTAAAIAAARAAKIPVMYVVVGFRPGFPEVNPNNKSFAGIKAMGGFVTDIHPRVAPQGDEPIIVKRRVSSLHGTDLDMILRAQGIRTLVMCGIATSGVVLSTFCGAGDADYELILLKDCCADRDPDVHEALFEKVYARRCTVSTAEDFAKAAKPRG